MAVVFTDNFTVTSDTNLSAYPSGSADYAYMRGSGTNLTVNAANDRVQSPSTTDEYHARIIDAAVPTTGGHEITATIYSSTTDSGMLLLRCSASADTCYLSYCDVTQTNEVQIYRFVAGTPTLIASADRSLSGAAARTWVFRAVTNGSQVDLTLTIGGTTALTYSDTSGSRITSGAPGIGIYNGTANTAYVDNVSVDDLTSGTQYTQAASGALTPAAALIRQTATAKAGSLTPSGAASRQAGKLLSGALTPAATLIRQVRTLLSGALTPSGALAAARTVLASMSGSLTPAGALIKRTALSASGMLAAASALTRQAAHILAGVLTPSGALASVRTFLQTVSGALTPSGAMTRRTGKLLSGALTGAGALTRRAAKAFVGALAPSGALTTIRAVLLSIGGALTPAGAVARQTAKTLSGALAPAGGLVKQIARALSGALTSVGALVSSLIGPGTATGRVRATFTSRRPSATFASRRPNVTFTVEEDA